MARKQQCVWPLIKELHFTRGKKDEATPKSFQLDVSLLSPKPPKEEAFLPRHVGASPKTLLPFLKGFVPTPRESPRDMDMFKLDPKIVELDLINDDKGDFDHKDGSDLIDFHKDGDLMSFAYETPHMNLSYSPKSVYSLYLDNDGIRFIEHYKKVFTSVLCLGRDDSHYFVHTFLRYANNNEAILYLLAAFGGLLMECVNHETDHQLNTDSKMKYITMAHNLIYDQYKDGLEFKCKEDFFTLFCFYLIRLSWEVCAGDTNHWHFCLTQCKRLIDTYGGLQKVLQDFSFSNDIKWLISDFQFHDMVNLSAVSQGTLFEIDQYKQISYSGFGIDPFQTICGPVYLLLGKINNNYVELTKEKELIKKLTDSEEKRYRRTAFYSKMESTSAQLSTELDECVPDEEHIQLLLEDVEELEMHMTFFELLAITCKIHLNATCRNLAPNNYEQQILLAQCIDRLEVLLSGRLQTALPIVFAICGPVCVDLDDRAKFRTFMKRGLSVYNFGNHKRVVELIEESWVRNPRGEHSINWFNVAQLQGWILSVG